MKNQPGFLKTNKNRTGTMNKQSAAMKTMKTNLELYRVVKGGSGGYRRLQEKVMIFRDTQTHRHFIIIYISSSGRLGVKGSWTTEPRPCWWQRSRGTTWQRQGILKKEKCKTFVAIIMIFFC